MTLFCLHFSNFEPGVKEIESVYSKLLENLRELLPQCSEASEQYSKLAKEVLRLKALCYASKLKTSKNYRKKVFDLYVRPQTCKHLERWIRNQSINGFVAGLELFLFFSCCMVL